MLRKVGKKQKLITRMIRKYADENKENYLAIKEGMGLYEDYLMKIGVERNSRKIITVEKFNTFKVCGKSFSK